MSDLTDADVAVHQLDSLIDYQDGSVVSRTLIKKKTGTVTLFAFDKGEELSEHTSPYEALVHILEGEADIFISGEKYHVPAGNMIVLPADDPHALKAPQPFKMLLTMIREK
ncbi:MAG: cupin domain-containing protein [Candidatus Marinimicrobia bacterium]|nr:cupin domain-containing protein [Candidatus Neomarinimicrobiota bacterium]